MEIIPASIDLHIYMTMIYITAPTSQLFSQIMLNPPTLSAVFYYYYFSFIWLAVPHLTYKHKSTLLTAEVYSTYFHSSGAHNT